MSVCCFFKQKTAYEMRISDWSSDVCSSDLEHWLEVTAALVDVLRVVVLCPPGDVDAKSASIVEARLRARSAVLVAWGEWPRPEARLSAERTEWVGAEQIGRAACRERVCPYV